MVAKKIAFSRKILQNNMQKRYYMFIIQPTNKEVVSLTIKTIISFLFCACFVLNTTSAQENTNFFVTSQPIYEAQPYYIGEMGEKWQFPSDHLPRGMSVGNLHIAFWNLLNKDYLHHILSNTQGLRDSSIMTDNVPVNSTSTMTIRELQTVQIILGMIYHPTHPRSLIAIQETHADVQKYLKEVLPSNWRVFNGNPPGEPSQDLYLYDTDVFDFRGAGGTKYTQNQPKAIHTLSLREKSSGDTYRFVQSHVPGGPDSAEGKAKFAEIAIGEYQPSETTILMGDMNASANTIMNALNTAAAKAGLQKQPFVFVQIDHPSHVNTRLEASWIDHFFIYRPAHLPGKVLSSYRPAEVHESLVPIVDLFRIYAIQGGS